MVLGQRHLSLECFISEKSKQSLGAQSRNHWATGEAPSYYIKNLKFKLLISVPGYMSVGLKADIYTQTKSFFPLHHHVLADLVL